MFKYEILYIGHLAGIFFLAMADVKLTPSHHNNWFHLCDLQSFRGRRNILKLQHIYQYIFIVVELSLTTTRQMKKSLFGLKCVRYYLRNKGKYFFVYVQFHEGS